MKRNFVLMVMLCSSMTVFSQNIITISEDTTFTETFEVTENTILQGTGNPTITFSGNPKLKAVSSTLMLKDFTMNQRSDFGIMVGEKASIEWKLNRMKGYMANYTNTEPTFLDGSPK